MNFSAPESPVQPAAARSSATTEGSRAEPESAEAAAREARLATQPRRGVVGWIVYDLGDTIFQQNMITNYFPVWVVAVMGGRDGQISLVNTVTMALMFAVGPWLGAISDHLPRRLPILKATTVGCCVLTFFVGGSLERSLLLLLGANLFFQAGVVIYDALLPAVSTAENRGRVGGIASGLSNLGALLGIGIGYVVLSAGGSYQTIFQLTAVAFFVLALPCFLFVEEKPRPVRHTSPLAIARVALRDVFDTARRARSYPDLLRFLIGRAFYAEAANTMGLFLGIYLTVQLGFVSQQKDQLLIIGLLFAVAGGLFWGYMVDHIGARDSLMRVLAVWSVALLLIAATGFLILPTDALWFIAPLTGFALGGIWASDRPLMVGLAPPEYLGQFYGLYALAGRFAALAGPLLWALVVDVLGWGRPVALLMLLGLVIIAMVILRPLPSAIGRPDASPVRPT